MPATSLSAVLGSKTRRSSDERAALSAQAHKEEASLASERERPPRRCFLHCVHFLRFVRCPVSQLPRRSLQIQTGDVRFNWRHAINNADLPSTGRRVSITFRRAKLS